MNLRERSGWLRLGVLLGSPLLWAAGSLQAAEWRKEFSLGWREIYSDNINLSPSKNSDLVTEITPGVLLVAEGNRLEFDLAYELQNLFYLEETGRNTANHRLDSQLDAELLEDRLYLDLVGRVTQQLLDRREGVSQDLISGSGNLQDVTAFRATPRWRERFGNLAEFDLSYSWDVVNSDNDDIDSEGERVIAELISGPGTGKLYWQGNYQSSRVEYDDGDRSVTEYAQAILGLQLIRQLALHVSGSYEDNEYIDARGANSPDDAYYGAGFTWTPSQRFRFSASYNERPDPDEGEDEHFFTGSLRWTPSSRTSFSAEAGNRFFGETYAFNFSHRARRSALVINYNETISDFRGQALSLENFGSLICPVGYNSLFQCRIFDANDPPGVGERTVEVNALLPSITENTFILESLTASYSIFGARNTITLNAGVQEREYVADGAQEEDLNLGLTWSHRFGVRTTSEFALRSIDRKFEDGVKDSYLYANWLLTRQVGPKLRVSLELAVNDRNAEVRGRDYTENRIVFSLLKQF